MVPLHVEPRLRAPQEGHALYWPSRLLTSPTLRAEGPEAVLWKRAHSRRWVLEENAQAGCLERALAPCPEGATCEMSGEAGYPLGLLLEDDTPSITDTWKRPMGPAIPVGASWEASPEAA